jgi:pimeloyl-ACP methyl ester carboxylesterase
MVRLKPDTTADPEGPRRGAGLYGPRSWLMVIIVVLAVSAPVAESADVSFKAADGLDLKGTFIPLGRGGPAILLLHQCNADRRIYDQLATMLNVAGYNVLALDFRQGGRDKWPGDVDAALNFLTSQGTVNPRALGVVGGSCGVSQAIHAARRHPAVRTLVLLSGGTDADGEAYVKDSPRIPIFGIASEEDTDAAASIRKIVGLSANRESRIEMLKDAGHAASMFSKQPELQADIVIWFRSNLPPGGYGLPPAIK